jgi:ubiquinone/menaquinone biosynthesis C-methylase UbiE
MDTPVTTSGSPIGRVRHPIFARIYERLSRKAEALGIAERRRELLAGLSGRVVEVGAGNGLNFAHYPPAVTEVVAVEPEPFLRDRAAEAAAAASVTVKVVDGTASALPLEDASCDAGVASLVLCSVPDQAAALAELRRVVRPGGELRFYEHVLAGTLWHARAQRFLDRTIWPHVSGGCHASRNTLAAIKAAGFSVESCERFKFRPMPGIPTSPHILGTARR